MKTSVSLAAIPAPGEVAVAQGGGDDQLTTAAYLHAHHALVPSRDDLPLPEGEREGVAVHEDWISLSDE